ncbi:hypothetical protein D3C87_1361400 [compost metagenome]
MGFETFEAAGFPKANTRLVALAGAEVDAIDVVLSCHIEPARQKPRAAALALCAWQKVQVDMGRKRISQPGWRVARVVDEMCTALIGVPCLLVANGVGIKGAQMRPPLMLQPLIMQGGIQRAGDVTADTLFVFRHKNGIGPQMQIRHGINMPHHAAIAIKQGGILPGIAGGETDGVERLFIFRTGGAEGQHLLSTPISMRAHAPTD